MFLVRVRAFVGERMEPEIERAEGEEDPEQHERVLDELRDDEDFAQRHEQGDDRECDEHARERAQDRLVARGRELSAIAPKGAQEQQAHGRLLDVESLDEVCSRRDPDDHDGELPRPLLTVGEPAGEPDQREPEGQGHHSRGRGKTGRENSSDEVVAVGELGRQGRDDPDRAREGCA